MQQAFIASVIAEGIEPKSAFPFEPYPADKTVYKNTRLMEFETPANKDGLGTATRLRKDSIPIQGIAKLKVWFRPAAPIFICRRSALRPIRRIWRARS